jgi:hypothetical protein
MALTSDRARKIYRMFGWGFAVSLVILGISAYLSLLMSADVAVSRESSRVIDLAPFLAIASLFTSFVTFIGFLISNTIAWRKDQRERNQFELDAEKKRLEIEKLRNELAAMKPTDNEAPTSEA